MNLLAGAMFFTLGRLTGRSYPRLKYFFWISMTVNLFTGTGYFLFSGIGGIGDWGAFIQGLGPQWLWRTGLTIFGAATYLLAARISLLELRPLIGRTVIPYGPPAEPLPIHKSWPLIVAACAIAIAFVRVLGPSVRFAR